MRELLNGSFNGEVTVPGDKSITHRAVMFGTLSKGTTHVYKPLLSEDTLDTVKCMVKLGADIDVTDEKITINSPGAESLTSPKELLYTGNSGTTTRLLMGLIAGLNLNAMIDGDDTIKKRPMDRVLVPLEMMNAKLKLNNERFTPVEIFESKLEGIEYDMPVASAQVKSAIIFASLHNKITTVIREQEKSRNHTELMLKAFGGNIEVDDTTITVNGGNTLTPVDVTVPGDISSAAFLMVLAAIIPDSKVTLKNILLNETRNGIIDVFNQIGADMTIEIIDDSLEKRGNITITYKPNLKAFTISGDIIPKLIDEIPILAVLALFLDGESIVRDAEELRVKETDRIMAVTNELSKYGAEFEIYEDGFKVLPSKLEIQDIKFKSYHDHRIAMMLIVMGIKMNHDIKIDNVECINISYPNFIDDLKSLKGR
ncbi:MAG TPA: 3-phosphoshikimate 1-carboxyvinyltransferase [Jeotgalicoccus sp.]|nr:3-phosphoshikimate 1-carboxyvinyltransferase [Jeotgalicoccus sp.]